MKKVFHTPKGTFQTRTTTTDFTFCYAFVTTIQHGIVIKVGMQLNYQDSGSIEVIEKFYYYDLFLTVVNKQKYYILK